MKFVIQRVKNASVTIEGALHASIGQGLLVFFCAEKGDNEEVGGASPDGGGINPNGCEITLSGCGQLEYFANKILKLRIFEDENGKMNRSVSDIKGEILVVSQFTLAASCKKGTRPSFEGAMEPVAAKKMYEKFVQIFQGFAAEGELKSVQEGVFGADMKISLLNDGPVTILM